MPLGAVAVVFVILCVAGSVDESYADSVVVVAVLALLLLALGSMMRSKLEIAKSHEVSTFQRTHPRLKTQEEQQSFRRLIWLAERIRTTLPELDGLLDSRGTADLVEETLEEAAKILDRKQKIRAVRDPLKQYESAASDLNRVRPDLIVQQKESEALWNEVEDDLRRLISRLEAAVKACEAYVQDRRRNDAVKLKQKQIDETLKRTGQVLADLSADVMSVEPFASERLSDNTTAVLSAYRELDELYGNRHD